MRLSDNACSTVQRRVELLCGQFVYVTNQKSGKAPVNRLSRYDQDTVFEVEATIQALGRPVDYIIGYAADRSQAKEELQRFADDRPEVHILGARARKYRVKDFTDGVKSELYEPRIFALDL